MIEGLIRVWSTEKDARQETYFSDSSQYWYAKFVMESGVVANFSWDPNMAGYAPYNYVDVYWGTLITGEEPVDIDSLQTLFDSEGNRYLVCASKRESTKIEGPITIAKWESLIQDPFPYLAEMIL